MGQQPAGHGQQIARSQPQLAEDRDVVAGHALLRHRGH
jgi:hypothetical protein